MTDTIMKWLYFKTKINEYRNNQDKVEYGRKFNKYTDKLALEALDQIREETKWHIKVMTGADLRGYRLSTGYKSLSAYCKKFDLNKHEFEILESYDCRETYFVAVDKEPGIHMIMTVSELIEKYWGFKMDLEMEDVSHETHR